MSFHIHYYIFVVLHRVAATPPLNKREGLSRLLSAYLVIVIYNLSPIYEPFLGVTVGHDQEYLILLTTTHRHLLKHPIHADFRGDTLKWVIQIPAVGNYSTHSGNLFSLLFPIHHPINNRDDETVQQGGCEESAQDNFGHGALYLVARQVAVQGQRYHGEG